MVLLVAMVMCQPVQAAGDASPHSMLADLTGTLGRVVVRSEADIAARLVAELQGRPATRPALVGDVEIVGTLADVTGRRLLMWNRDHGWVAIYVSMTAEVTGALVPGDRVHVRGEAIEDFVKVARNEVMARAVTTIKARSELVAGL